MTAEADHDSADGIVRRLLEGDGRAAARALTLIENRDPRARAVLKALYPRTGKAHVVGVTGIAGSGKSTLIARLTGELRGRGKKIGILMVDPTSAFSGGALLGDRLRMRDYFLDGGVFMRSFATRRGLGGISPGIADAVQLLDAMGEDVVFVETIGIGQDQVQVAAVVHTVVVALTPGVGDEVQAMKAGILEIADVVAVNKADLPGAAETAQRIRALFEGTELAVIESSALTGEGIAALLAEIERHRERLPAGGQASRQRSLSRQYLLSILQEEFLAEALEEVGNDSLEEMVGEIAARRLDPYTAAEGIVRKVRSAG